MKTSILKNREKEILRNESLEGANFKSRHKSSRVLKFVDVSMLPIAYIT